MPLTQYIALIADTANISMSELTKVAAALDKQVKRDFGPSWDVNASVNAFQSMNDVPTDYWPVVIKDSIPYSAAGIHLDEDGQPFALVKWSSRWSQTASHEVLEMLADPFGNRVVAGDSPHPDQGRVNFLVEVCDPSEASEFGYTVNGVQVSDFYFDTFFNPVASPSVQYSFTSKITRPRQILRGGYISWFVPETREAWQQIWFNTPEPTFRRLGVFNANQYRSLRAFVDHNTLAPLEQKDAEDKRPLVLAAGYSSMSSVESACAARASQLNGQIETLLKSGSSHVAKKAPKKKGN